MLSLARQATIRMSAPPTGLVKKFTPVFQEYFQFHRVTPLLSPDQYRRFKNNQRAQRALSSVRVYLDTNHWIQLRDVHRGTKENKNYARLLQLLRQLSKSHKIAVPVSDQLVTELCNQADLATRRATASIVDELSGGVTIVGSSWRTVLEVRQWVESSLHKADPLPLQNVWTSLPHALQSHDWTPDCTDPALLAAWSKAVEDTCDILRLTDLLPSLDSVTFDVSEAQALADALTANKPASDQGPATFPAMFQQEADRYLEMILPKMQQEVIKDLENLAAQHNLADDDLVDAIKRIFKAQNRSRTHPQALPGLRIIAGCVSRISTEPDRKFKHGDPADILHAYAAIPYCNIFLTDSSMRHLVTSTPTDLSSLYDCTVLDDPEAAVEHLQDLVAQQA